MADTPQVLILGDSHTLTLKMGCDALGIRAVHAWIGGLHWNDNVISLGGAHGIQALHRPRMSAQIETAAQALNVTDLTDPGVPVLGSFGFHLGRLSIGMIVQRQHFSTQPGFSFDHAADSVFSQDYAEDYVTEKRGPILDIAAAIAKNTDLTMIKQPLAKKANEPVVDGLAAIIAGRLEAQGTRVFPGVDDMTDPKTGLVDPKYLEDDGGHGNEEYGTRTVQAMIDQGFLKL